MSFLSGMVSRAWSDLTEDNIQSVEYVSWNNVLVKKLDGGGEAKSYRYDSLPSSWKDYVYWIDQVEQTKRSLDTKEQMKAFVVNWESRGNENRKQGRRMGDFYLYLYNTTPSKHKSFFAMCFLLDLLKYHSSGDAFKRMTLFRQLEKMMYHICKDRNEAWVFLLNEPHQFFLSKFAGTKAKTDAQALSPLFKTFPEYWSLFVRQCLATNWISMLQDLKEKHKLKLRIDVSDKVTALGDTSIDFWTPGLFADRSNLVQPNMTKMIVERDRMDILQYVSNEVAGDEKLEQMFSSNMRKSVVERLRVMAYDPRSRYSSVILFWLNHPAELAPVWNEVIERADRGFLTYLNKNWKQFVMRCKAQVPTFGRWKYGQMALEAVQNSIWTPDVAFVQDAINHPKDQFSNNDIWSLVESGEWLVREIRLIASWMVAKKGREGFTEFLMKQLNECKNMTSNDIKECADINRKERKEKWSAKLFCYAVLCSDLDSDMSLAAMRNSNLGADVIVQMIETQVWLIRLSRMSTAERKEWTIRALMELGHSMGGFQSQEVKSNNMDKRFETLQTFLLSPFKDQRDDLIKDLFMKHPSMPWPAVSKYFKSLEWKYASRKDILLKLFEVHGSAVIELFTNNEPMYEEIMEAMYQQSFQSSAWNTIRTILKSDERLRTNKRFQELSMKKPLQTDLLLELLRSTPSLRCSESSLNVALEAEEYSLADKIAKRIPGFDRSNYLVEMVKRSLSKCRPEVADWLLQDKSIKLTESLANQIVSELVSMMDPSNERRCSNVHAFIKSLLINDLRVVQYYSPSSSNWNKLKKSVKDYEWIDICSSWYNRNQEDRARFMNTDMENESERVLKMFAKAQTQEASPSSTSEQKRQ